MKKLLALLIMISVLNSSNAQVDTTSDAYTISINWDNETNQKHKYKNIYSQKDEDYLKWVYQTSKNVTQYAADPENESMYYHDGRGNDLITFTIKKDHEIYEETYRNAVKPTHNFKSNFSIFIPKPSIPKIEGSLPKGITTYFSDSSKGYEMGIETDNNERDVKIEILDMGNNLIHIIEDKVLEKGWNHYKWDVQNIQPGRYILQYTVDENRMTQEIEINDRTKSILGRFFEWLF